MRLLRSIPLYQTLSQSLIDASLYTDLTSVDIHFVESQWKPWSKFFENRAGNQGRSTEFAMEHLHWDWSRKQGLPHWKFELSFGLYVDKQCQGLMLLRNDLSSRLPESLGDPLLYIDFLEIAPWNLKVFEQVPIYKGIGTQFMKVAILLSQWLGYAGRIGLHSLPQAESFYHACGMVDLGLDVNYGDLVYFEYQTSSALKFLDREGT